jgi:hypothetical protein
MTPQPPSQGDGGTSEDTDEAEEEDGDEVESPPSFG